MGQWTKQKIGSQGTEEGSKKKKKENTATGRNSEQNTWMGKERRCNFGVFWVSQGFKVPGSSYN